MEPRISIITLGVTDLPRSVKFYRDGLGLPLFSENTESIAFFQESGHMAGFVPPEVPGRRRGCCHRGQRFFRSHPWPITSARGKKWMLCWT